MTNGRVDEPGTKDSHHVEDDDHRLEAVIGRLNAQIAAFEQKLESAMQAESQFRNNIQPLLDSLDAFVDRHVEKDRHLTQLIEEDTQRSKEAKEEYDALASRFDDNLRRDNFRRTRDWLRTMSLYVGLLLSVVFMAPFHVLWWILTRSLARTGLFKSPEEAGIYSTVRKRRRDITHKITSPNHPDRAERHRGLAAATSGPLSKEGESAAILSSALKKKEAAQNDANVPDASNAQRGNKVRHQKHRNVSHPIALATARNNGEEAVSNYIQRTGSISNYGEMTCRAESSESDEEYFDARNGSERHSPHSGEARPTQAEQVGTEEEEDDKNATRENAPPRPGWAVPAGSDDPLPDLSAFPSSDFWEISDEDIRLEVQRSGHGSS